ncbi:MAG TPA: arginine deiminase family protein [Candidatus Aminicenantes bacterium]|nr:arginine deiminase family protein [Candidatus Aminicenantes bacterium]
MFRQAIVRTPGPDFAAGLTTATLGEPDYELMRTQHEAYVQELTRAGLQVEVLDPLPGFPDSYFVEDPAVILPDVAIVTRPGALARRGEAAAIAPVLARYRPLARIEEPGTLDGGDVLVVGPRVFVGISERTNRAGFDQFRAIVARHGRVAIPVPVGAGLHLKSGVNLVAPGTLLLVPSFAGRTEFAGYRTLTVPAGEEYAANVLWLGDRLLHPTGFPATEERLATLGTTLVGIDTSEARKMDGGLTCMSLRF